METPVFYPALSEPDLHLFRAPGPGLGNLLFPWARAVVLTELTGGTMISPTWRNLKIGTILRREKDLRTYGNLFHHRRPSVIFRDLIFKLKANSWIDEDDFHSNPRPAFVKIQGLRNEFSDIAPHSRTIHDKLVQICRHPSEPSLGGIGMHIRLGDFHEAAEQKYSRNSRVPIEWFVAEANRIRSILGPLRITIFSDDTSGLVARSFSTLENVRFANNGTAIQDILRLATASHIVCSNSTFSLWSVFLSNATFSAKFPELFSDYGIDDARISSGFLRADSSL